MPEPLIVIQQDIDHDTALVLLFAPMPDHVVPLHRGHHPVWEGVAYHLDICNMVDDVVVCDYGSGTVYRFPITADLLPWLVDLIGAMNIEDIQVDAEVGAHNTAIRNTIMAAAKLVLNEVPVPLYVFEPGVIKRTDSGVGGLVDQMLAAIIAERGAEAFVR